MLETWNKRFVREPPSATEKFDIADIDRVATKEARGKVFDLLKIFEKDESLKLEMITLARLHYKFCNQWRREKCLRNMKQIEKCLKRFHEMGLEKSLSYLLNNIPGKLSKNERIVYLPTRRVIEFALMRLLGAGALLKKSTALCLCAYRNLSQQMSAQLFVTSMMIISAAVSRIWVLCQSYLIKISKCYTALLHWSKTLKSSDQSQTNENEEVLPADIYLWLNETVDHQHNILEQNERELHLFDSQSSPDELLWPNVVSGDDDVNRAFGSTAAEDLGKRLARKGDKLPPSATDLKLFKDGKKPETLQRLLSKKKKKQQKKNSNIMKKVNDILQLRGGGGGGGGDGEIPASVETSQEFHTFTESELTDWRGKLDATDSVGQLGLVLKSINKAFPGEKFRGLKKCRNQMKRLKKKTSRNIGRDRSTRKKENDKILDEGKKIMKCFLRKNNTKKRDKRLNVTDDNMVVVMTTND